MSFIDLIAILLIICLCYIGYSKGIKGKTFFLSSFAFSCFLMYFIFEEFFKKLTSVVPNLIVAGILSIGFVLIPIFVLTEFILRKTLTGPETKSFSNSKNIIKIESKILGAVIGFIGGYAFVLTIISLTLRNSNEPPLFDPPGFIENSFFYKIASMKMQESDIKHDNISSLSFLYKGEVRQKYEFSSDELLIILKMIKGISNASAAQVAALDKENTDQAFLKLKELYEKESEVMPAQYKVQPPEIETLFARFKPKREKRHFIPVSVPAAVSAPVNI